MGSIVRRVRVESGVYFTFVVVCCSENMEGEDVNEAAVESGNTRRKYAVKS